MACLYVSAQHIFNINCNVSILASTKAIKCFISNSIKNSQQRIAGALCVVFFSFAILFASLLKNTQTTFDEIYFKKCNSIESSFFLHLAVSFRLLFAQSIFHMVYAQDAHFVNRFQWKQSILPF